MSHSLSIYHLSCSNGTPIFIHPFLNARNILAIQNNTTITGMYGEEPRVEAITMLRNDLYRCIDNAVRDWINERRLIPRFLIAAAVFFLTYIVLAFAVRDPLPVLDELILGIVTAVVTYVLIGRKFENSNRAVKQRIMLREKIDSIVFTEHPYVKKNRSNTARCGKRTGGKCQQDMAGRSFTYYQDLCSTAKTDEKPTI